MKENGIYYIENTIDEKRSKIVAYFETLKEAEKGLESCQDWFKPLGTGKIYFREYGLNKKSQLICEVS